MPSSSTVVLPSIREMFPEYLIPASKPIRGPAGATGSHGHPGPTTSIPARNHFLSSSMPLCFSFDSKSTVLPSPPSTTSLLRSPTSTGSDNELAETESASDGLTSESGDAEPEADESGSQAGDASSNSPTRKHLCPQCGKRFNRPSSLRIHVNTHTGATPFRCPYPNCGRAFNVNSNMRRHYRNHSVALSAAAGAVSARPGSSCTSTFSACSSSLDPVRVSPVHSFSEKTRRTSSKPPPLAAAVDPTPRRAHPYHLRPTHHLPRSHRGSNSPSLSSSPHSKPSSPSTRSAGVSVSPRAVAAPPLILAFASWDVHSRRDSCGYEESAVRGR
ncbi:hypothetical protein C8F01DRAFT_102194 [Mycena amicta]|nr:hypothetical protein C8F01DRAFT_102194 [Mycena amicta]